MKFGRVQESIINKWLLAQTVFNIYFPPIKCTSSKFIHTYVLFENWQLYSLIVHTARHLFYFYVAVIHPEWYLVRCMEKVVTWNNDNVSRSAGHWKANGSLLTRRPVNLFNGWNHREPVGKFPTMFICRQFRKTYTIATKSNILTPTYVHTNAHYTQSIARSCIWILSDSFENNRVKVF